MPRLDILLPFALPPAELSTDLRRELATPALATLSTRSTRCESETFEEFERALPHEIWLARQFGLEPVGQGSPKLARALMRTYDLDADAGTWFILHPVHIHIARDHLVLTDPNRLELNDDESSTLFDIARPLFEEYGKPLVYGDARTWFTRADDWSELSTATPDAASGHNIDIWMPRGPGERDWRKLQNEVQMHWFTHPLNAEREAHGQLAVNSLWLWGAAGADTHARSTYDAVYNPPSWAGALAPAADASGPSGIPLGQQAHALLILDQLRASVLASDWGRWLQALNTLEQDWFSPLLDALRDGNIDEITVTATGENRLRRFTATRTSLRKFWRKPSLDALLS